MKPGDYTSVRFFFALYERIAVEPFREPAGSEAAGKGVTRRG